MDDETWVRALEKFDSFDGIFVEEVDYLRLQIHWKKFYDRINVIILLQLNSVLILSSSVEIEHLLHYIIWNVIDIRYSLNLPFSDLIDGLFTRTSREKETQVP